MCSKSFILYFLRMLIRILEFIDKYIFGSACLLLFWVKYIPLNIKNPRKVLVIRLWALWSSLIIFPMVKQLKEFYGNNVEIDLLATSRNIWVFKNQWYFKNSYNLFKLKDFLRIIFSFKKYDIVIDTEEYFRISALLSAWIGKISIWFWEIFSRKICYNFAVRYSYQHQVIECLRLLVPLWIKYKVPKNLEPLKYTDNEKNKVNKFLEKFDWKIKICMHIAWSENSPDRFWSILKWKKLIEKLIDIYGDNVIIFLSWTSFEKKRVKNLLSILNDKYKKQIVSLVNKFNLFEFAYFLEKCNLMVSNDTWPMHLAAAMGTKTIWLFWPSLPIFFWAWPLDKNVNIYKWSWKNYMKMMEWKLEIDREKNIEKIEVEDVLKEIEKIIWSWTKT